MSKNNIKSLMFADDGRIPNNTILPLIVYIAALPQVEDDSGACQKLFERNEWHGTWVNGVYRYHHYHSTAHEVLGVISGTASIQFGGAHGKVLRVNAGDVVIIPAGVGHCNQGASNDFRVVGAYPSGQHWDLCTGDPKERPDVIENIRRVSLPKIDPVYGEQGPLLQIWKS